MAESHTTTGAALEPCPLKHHVSAGLKAYKTGRDPRIICLDCGLSLAAPDWTTVYERWQSRSRVSAGVAPNVDAMWEALKVACCKNPAEAKLAVFVSEKKFKDALAPFAPASVAPQEQSDDVSSLSEYVLGFCPEKGRGNAILSVEGELTLLGKNLVRGLAARFAFAAGKFPDPRHWQPVSEPAPASTVAPQTKSCGFCGKSDQEVKALIQAPVGYICEECVAICAGIIKRNGVAPQEQSEPPHDYAVTASTQCSNCGGGIADYWTYCHRCGANRETMTAPASPADIRDEAEHLSAFVGSGRLSVQEDKPVKNYDDFRAGMLRAAEMARSEFKRAPEASKGHDCVYMGGYEDACDHLSIVIAQAAVIDSVRIAGAQPDWQYHISLLFPDGIEDQTLLKIFQVVEHELRAAATPPSTLAKAAAAEIYDLDQPTLDQIQSVILKRCFSTEGEDTKSL